MNDCGDLHYSVEAAVSRYLFYMNLNDINIFVEDANREYEYETIFNRLFDNQFRITAIFGLGGKIEVKKCFDEFGVDHEKIKNFYIVDGDFDRYIHSEEMIDNPHFIYLKTYNIENYFVDENACLQFAKGRLKCSDKLVKKRINFFNWKDTIVEQSSKLFLCYCFIQKYFPQIATISRSPYEFIDQKTGFERTDGAYQEYLDYILNLDCDAIKKIDEIKKIYCQINGADYFNLICGKFLLNSLCCYLRSIIKAAINNDDFKWHLINNFNISKLDYIKDRILPLVT